MGQTEFISFQKPHLPGAYRELWSGGCYNQAHGGNIRLAAARRELWKGLVELRRLPHSDLLHDAAGAFTTIVTWASDAVEFRQKAECLADSLGLYVFGVEHEHPVANDMDNPVIEEIADLIERAESNPNAILYGTFHTYQRDQA